MPVQIEERLVRGVTILDLSGPLTVDGYGRLKDTIHGLVQQGRRRVMLNLQGVSLIDSIGVAEIVRAYVALHSRGGKLKLIHLKRPMRELFTITGLLTVLETYASEHEAITSFSAIPDEPSRT